MGDGAKSEGDGEYTSRDEHRVLWATAESLHCTPETKRALYVNYTGIKK